MPKIIIYTDGGARGNPGPAGAGAVIYEGDPSNTSRQAKKIAEVKQFVGEKQTNNWAEYEAVVIALGRAIELGYLGRDVELRLDSQLVVEQLKGNWKIKEPTLKPQVARARRLLGSFGTVKFTYIPREENKDADRLVNEAIDEEL